MQTLRISTFAGTIGVSLGLAIAAQGQVSPAPAATPATPAPAARPATPAVPAPPATTAQAAPGTITPSEGTILTPTPTPPTDRTFRGRVTGKTGSTALIDGQAIDLRYFSQRVEVGDVVTGQAQVGANDIWSARTLEIDSAATFRSQQQDRQEAQRRRDMRASDRNYVRQPNNRNLQQEQYEAVPDQNGNYIRPNNYAAPQQAGGYNINPATGRPYYDDRFANPRRSDPRNATDAYGNPLPQNTQPLPGVDPRFEEVRPNYYWEQEYWRNQQRDGFRGIQGREGVFQPNDTDQLAPTDTATSPRSPSRQQMTPGTRNLTPGIARPPSSTTLDRPASPLRNNQRAVPGAPGSIAAPPPATRAVPPAGPAVPPAGPAVPPAGPAVPPAGPAIPPNGPAVPPEGVAVPPTGPAIPPSGPAIPPAAPIRSPTPANPAPPPAPR